MMPSCFLVSGHLHGEKLYSNYFDINYISPKARNKKKENDDAIFELLIAFFFPDTL